ncbi:hypothetical protein Hokovirus_3_46 [Hokovirus HKV1]|uniref:Uncharacterized protein n=1 Tax=Hokovirus HKV1 TaxID=1977638 RepID=A0A1V0SGD4_9VIRU|nr:hypothetical protein Hokovirus_3_46 [Hokovirus HKV1]
MFSKSIFCDSPISLRKANTKLPTFENNKVDKIDKLISNLSISNFNKQNIGCEETSHFLNQATVNLGFPQDNLTSNLSIPQNNYLGPKSSPNPDGCEQAKHPLNQATVNLGGYDLQNHFLNQSTDQMYNYIRTSSFSTRSNSNAQLNASGLWPNY